MVAPCTKLLRVPGYVLGVVDFHGQLVPLIDLPARLGLCGPRSPESLFAGHIAFVELPSGLWGMAVDGVHDLINEPMEPLFVEPRHLVGMVLGSLRVSPTERALVLNPSQLLSVVARTRIADELLDLVRQSAPTGETA